MDLGISLVNPQWINARVTETRLIDVRRTQDYEAGHIPGAKSLPVTEFVKIVGRLKDAPEPDEFSNLMRHLGVCSNSPVVVYDDQRGVYASRLLWTLELYGHSNLHLLDRNFSTYAQDGGDTTQDEPEVPSGSFTARSGKRLMATMKDIQDVLHRGSGLVLDAGERMDFLNGHILGALNLSWQILVDRKRSFLPKERLKQIFKEHGLEKNTQIIVYCKDGMTSSHLYVALRLAGHDNVKLYSRGYAEWEETKQPVKAEFQELLNP